MTFVDFEAFLGCPLKSTMASKELNVFMDDIIYNYNFIKEMQSTLNQNLTGLLL